eukprot:g10272.t1
MGLLYDEWHSTSLKITGIPDVNGVMPKIIGAVGLKRLFIVEGGGKLILNGLNLTAGIEVRVDFFCSDGPGGVCYDGSLAGYDASTNGNTTDSSYLAALSGFKHPLARNYTGWQDYCKSWSANDGTFNGGLGTCKTKMYLINVEQAVIDDSKGASQNCSNSPTQCEENGYYGGCITRQNTDAGVMCSHNCSIGTHKSGIFNHKCAACIDGTYNPSWNQNQCQSWSDCSTGQYISTDGTNSSDRVCSSCGSGKYSALTNAFACANWTDCVAGQKRTASGTAIADHTCVVCPTGKFSTTSNQNTCTDWTTCNATTVEINAGSTTADRVCGPTSATTTASPTLDDLGSMGSCIRPTLYTTIFFIAWSVLQ